MIEFGSDFHYPDGRWFVEAGREPYFDSRFSLFFSGRSALLNLLVLGKREYGWKKVWLPTYYCHEVAHFLPPAGLEIGYYDYVPNQSDRIPDQLDQEANVVVAVNYFGLETPDWSHLKLAAIIEDLTHCLGSVKNSAAHYCFGSLRKELPVPCGGFVYSPKGLALPSAQPSAITHELAMQKLTAMFLKREYLEGRFADKPYFRSLFASAEESFEIDQANGFPGVAGSLLNLLDVDAILQAKATNTREVLEILRSDKANFGKGQTGFGLTLVCDSGLQRDQLRNLLVSNNIYPAVLWPGQNSERAAGLGSRVLFVHTDYRYSDSHIGHIAQIIKDFFS